jgi:hypothetical protein
MLLGPYTWRTYLTYGDGGHLFDLHARRRRSEASRRHVLVQSRKQARSLLPMDRPASRIQPSPGSIELLYLRTTVLVLFNNTVQASRACFRCTSTFVCCWVLPPSRCAQYQVPDLADTATCMQCKPRSSCRSYICTYIMPVCTRQRWLLD